MKALAITVGAAIALAGAASAQAFFNTCEPTWYVTFTSANAWMYAKCRSRSGASVTSRLDLNHCVGNNNGALIADEGGRFRGTCQDCVPNDKTLFIGDVELPSGITIPGLTAPTSTLTCSCRKKDKSMVLGTTLDLNRIVGNGNGILNCHGHTGERV